MFLRFLLLLLIPKHFHPMISVEALLHCTKGTPESHARATPILETPAIQEQTCCIFLVDGSGSVTEDDFNCMTSFMIQVAEYAAETDTPTHLGVIQFSNDVQVEATPLLVDKDASQFRDVVLGMHRMNGGTNIALAVQKAGVLFKNMPLSKSRRVIALLTDGRVDSYQVREARDMVSRLADEEHIAVMHAFGVGRGVDKQELIRIISGACGEYEAINNYLPLLVLDDAPW